MDFLETVPGLLDEVGVKKNIFKIKAKTLRQSNQSLHLGHSLVAHRKVVLQKSI